ncbi:hypothetical protein JG687_00008925 [Phytophthora cactorum]|uniref:Centromere protein J C-terminal domain-containing protein n=1 Tax=Phytophthora cactorum TaxID=29920 RepID=A0A8T1UE79_9STRA|nr:hypothetical protein JG687_00008925 [Phytophthora cactorum]
MAPGRAWRKENDVSNRRVSVTSSEDVAVPSANVPFEELLARELRKSGGTDAKKSAPASGAKQKVVKHTLVSKREEAAKEEEVLVGLIVENAFSSRDTTGADSDCPSTATDTRGQQNEEFNTWKNASFRSTTSTDMGLINVRKSYEAKQEREANEMAEFEAIERDLAAEKEAHLKEKQQQSSAQVDRQDQVHENQTDHQGLPYSSFVSELHDQEQSRWQTAGSGSIFDDSLDEGADSELVFDDHSALSKDDWVAGDNGFTNQLRSHFGYGGNDYGNAISDLSAVSFDDSVPWDDDPDDDSTDTLGYNRPPAGDAPVSSLVQQVFGGVKQDDSNNTGILSDEDDVDSIDAEADSSKMNLSPPPPPPAQDKSLSTLKQKLRVIEEKLFELEEEVKFYKSETLQLQKRKDYYDQEVKKLALERDEFARYQQEQRVLIEKEWERERAKMKKEEKLQERQWKLRMNATIAHQDRKDRGEVEMLKAQIVKMQLDEKARVSKWKAGNDNLRQRVAELEEKNRELSDEIKFLEKDRLEQWEKYERLLKERQEAPRSASKPENISAVSEKNELRTVDDLFAIKGTADELLQRWSFPHEDGLTQDCEEKNHTFEHHQRYVADEYNPQRYSLDREDPHPSSESVDFSDGNGFESANENGFASATSAAASYEWALPDAEDVYTTGCSSEADIAISASTSPLSEHRMVSQEIDHPGGKKELLFTDGSKKIIFADGNEKEIEANGHVVIKFTNGDHKEVFPDTGITVYYYHEAQTKLTTYADNRKVYEFPNQQIETSLPDGTTEIQFADGIKKTIRPNGDEFSVFPDGTTMLEQPDGLREVTLLNQKKIRYFPDGQMACVTPGGQETRVCSDSELKQLMAST